MGITLVLVAACVAVLLSLMVRQLPVEGPGHGARNHLTEFSRAWWILVAFYLLKALLSRFSPAVFAYLVAFDEAHVRSFVVYHLVVSVFCVATNFFLCKAIFELSLVYRDKIPESFVPQGGALFLVGRRIVMASSSRYAIGLSFVLTLLLLLAPLADPSRYGAFAETGVFLSYCVQLFVSSSLFLHLSRVYWKVVGGLAAAAFSSLYALLQLAYPAQVLPRNILALWHLTAESFSLYNLVLTGAKILLVAGIIKACFEIKRRARDAKAASDFLRIPGTIEDEGSTDPLDRLGLRLRELAALRRMVQLCATLLLLVFIVLAVLYFYPRTVHYLSREYPPPLVLAFRALWALPVFLALQSGLYLVFFLGAPSVPWKRLCANGGALSNLLSHENTDGEDGKWKHETLERRPGGGESSSVQLIFLHGIFSSASRCWGLLPAILLKDRRVARAHLLTYKHSLWSGGDRLVQIQQELAGKILMTVGKAEEPTIIFAHSLGGILLMRSILEIVSDGATVSIARRLRHHVCIATPLQGSKYALLGSPWSWPNRLRRGSTFVRETVERFTKVFVAPGKIVGEEAPLGSFTFYYGTRDDVAGTDLMVLNLPGTPIPVSSWHSASQVFDQDSALAVLYRGELSPTSRSVRLMRTLCCNLIGKRRPYLAVIFSQNGHGLADAKVLEEFRSEVWGQKEVTPSQSQGSLFDVLRSRLPRGSFDQLVAEVDRRWDSSFDARQLLALEIDQGFSVHLFANCEAGFAIMRRT